jgi:hypothetical protein
LRREFRALGWLSAFLRPRPIRELESEQRGSEEPGVLILGRAGEAFWRPSLGAWIPQTSDTGNSRATKPTWRKSRRTTSTSDPENQRTHPPLQLHPEIFSSINPPVTTNTGRLSSTQRLSRRLDVVHPDRRVRKSDVAHRPRRLVSIPRQFSGCRVHRHALQSDAKHI